MLWEGKSLLKALFLLFRKWNFSGWIFLKEYMSGGWSRIYFLGNLIHFYTIFFLIGFTNLLDTRCMEGIILGARGKAVNKLLSWLCILWGKKIKQKIKMSDSFMQRSMWWNRHMDILDYVCRKGFSDKVNLSLRFKWKGKKKSQPWSSKIKDESILSRRNCEDKGPEADRSLLCSRKRNQAGRLGEPWNTREGPSGRQGEVP